MAFILLEGLDRSGKSTVAELYKKKGYKVVHMNAPDKKYFEQGYSGPSYLEEIVDMYSAYNGKNVLFDRTCYGELVWPIIYGRKALLSAEDLEYLQQLENNSDTTKILMYDESKEAHWQRCVDNKEPLNRMQFVQAGRLYDDLAREYGFERKQLKDFVKIEAGKSNSKNESASSTSETRTPEVALVVTEVNTLETKLERANAIRDLLSTSLVKKKGDAFLSLDQDIKRFLEKELENIFTEKKTDDFTNDEVKILKIYAQRIKDKMG